MSTLNATNLKHASATSNNIVLAADGTVSFASTITFTGLSTSSFATYDQIVGVTSTGITTSTVTAVTLSGTGVNISNGNYVTGIGVPPGTVVSSGGGTVNLVLSAPVGFTTSSNVLNFHPNTKPVSAGVLGGQLCRAWVNFDGSHATPKIRASYNVSSITKNATGDYTVNFTTAMVDASYSGLVSIMRFSTGSFSDIAQLEANGMNASNVRVRVSTTSANFDSAVICVAIFR